MSDVAPIANADMPLDTAKSPRYARYVFLIMFLINLLNYMDRFVFTGAANVIGKELHFGIDQIGFLASAFLIVYTLGTVPLGIWADRAKRKNVVAICIAVWSIATALTALAGNFLALFLSRMILGIGEAGYYPAGTALMSDYFSRKKRARVMSYWGAGALIGLMLGYIIGGQVAGIFPGSWRWAFVFTGIPGLILAWLSWRLREPRRNEADDAAFELDPHSLANATEIEDPPHAIVVPRTILAQFGSLLRIKTMAVLILMQIFAFFVLGANTSFLPLFLQQSDVYGMSSGEAGIISGGIIAVAGIAGLLLGGVLSDLLNKRYPGARVLVCGIGFLIGAPTYALSVITSSLPLFLLCFVVTAMLLNIYNGPSTAATQDVVPSGLRASAVAISLLLAHLFGDTFAPSIVGVLAHTFDPTHGTHFANNMAGHDLQLALLITCPPGLIIAGLIGIFGSRWMKSDLASAEAAERLERSNSAV
jgi:MFS family permease